MIREWFALDGIKCDERGIALLNYAIRPIPPQTVETVQVPGMQGAYVLLPGTYGQRQIVIQCAQLSDDELDLAQNLWQLKGWLSGKRRLMLWDREGIEYDAYLSDTSEIDNQALWGEFTLTFTCDPIGYGVERVYPIGLPFVGGGNSDAPCVLQFTPAAAVNGITFTHSAGVVRILGSIAAGSVVNIDGIQRYVTINGADAMLRLAIDSDWPVAMPGTNTIVASAAGAGTVRFHERWT